jgi:hypothetical protein
MEGKDDLDAWWEAAGIIALLYPTSCEVERFFSVAKGTTKKSQFSMLEDTQETRLMTAFNGDE